MKKTIRCVVLLFSVFTISHLAHAGSYLVSAPLPRGESGNFTCTCTNISKKDISLSVYIKYGVVGTAGVVSDGIVSPGNIRTISTVLASSPTTSYCEVTPYLLSITKSVTAKKVLCTFSVIDSNGSPQITIPVNTKLKR